MKIRSSRVYCDEKWIPAVITIENGKIIRISPDAEEVADYNYNDARILPGFIDIHCHGAYGFDTNYADPEGLRKWAAGIPSEGVTSFLATTITDHTETLKKALLNVAAVRKEDYKGARIIGVHLEGPYLSLKYKGAQPPEAIVKPSVEEFRMFQDCAEGAIKVVTLAPEEDTDFKLTSYLRETGVVPSMGHSDASFDTAVDAVRHGAMSITHTYNAMSPLNHRENGLVGTALGLHDLYSEIICDTRHCTANALNIFYTCKDKDHAVMVSDALMCKGYPAGTKFLFGGHEIEIYPDGTAHLTESGSLAGSTLKLNEGLRNVIEKAGVDEVKAINSCTINPARLLKEDDHIGLIKENYDADLTVLDDSYQVLQTFCKGIPQL